MPGSTSAVIGSGGQRGRYTSLSSSKAFRIAPNPVILDIGSTVLRVGIAGSSSPKHLIEMEHAIFDKDYSLDDYVKFSSCDGKRTRKVRSKTKTYLDWYIILSSLIEQMYDRLMFKPSTRRVVCLYSNKLYAPPSFQKALQQLMWNRGVPAIVEMDQLQCLSIAQGWNRGLVVQITREEAICIVSSDGQLLSNTYQMVPTSGYKHWLETESINGRTEHVLREKKPPSDDGDGRKSDTRLMSLVSAIISCLDSCPIDLKIKVASNIVFCGDGVHLLPNLPLVTMKLVRNIIMQGDSNVATIDNHNGDHEGKGHATFAAIPIDVAKLRPLVPKLSLISCSPYRADLICFAGASLWASVWGKSSYDESPVKWMINTA